MIIPDRWQLQSIETGRFVKMQWRAPGFAAGEKPRPVQHWRELVEEQTEGDSWPRWHIERATAENRLMLDMRLFRIVPAPSCGCCGSNWWRDGWGDSGPLRLMVDASQVENRTWRCEKHVERNPCAIEGCRRTTAAPESGRLGSDQWLCGEHWRRFVPPRSLRRRAYHAYFRRAKREGWSPPLRRKFWRFWDSLVASARSRAAGGHIDKGEIERLFGT